MARKIEKNISWFLVLSLAMLSISWFFLEPANSADVTVSATVASIISCSTPAGSTAFGSMNQGSVYTSDTDATTTVSSNGSVYVKIKDAGDTSNPGLYKSAGTTDLIGSADAASGDTATLSAGTEGYGIQASTTDSIEIATRYLQTGDNVGGFEITDQTLASSSAAVTAEVITVIHKAAVSSSNLAGDYADTITYTCSAS